MARRKDGLYKRENGILTFRYKDEYEQWKEKSTGEVDRDTAKKFKADFLESIENGTLPNDKAVWRLDQAAKWWNEIRKPRIAESTANSERYRLQHFQRILGNKRLAQIRSHDLDLYQSKRLDEGVGAHSINKEILLLSQVLRKAKAWRRLQDDYKPLKTKVSDIGQALTRDGLRKLAMIAGTRKDWEAAFYGSVLAVNTGLRGGEIKKLRIGAVDLEHRRLIIKREDAKTDASARHIELNLSAREAAARLLIRAQFLKAIEPTHFLMPKHLSRIMWRTDDQGRRVHIDRDGVDAALRGYDPNQHQGYWDTAWHNLTEAIECSKCETLQAPAEHCRVETCNEPIKGLKSQFSKFRFHDLRHTFITHMVELGVPLGVIQTFVGHLSNRMIRHYTHISSGAARRAVELLDQEPMLTPMFLSEATPPSESHRRYQ